MQVLKNIDKTEIFQTCRFSRQMKAVKTQKKKQSNVKPLVLTSFFDRKINKLTEYLAFILKTLQVALHVKGVKKMMFSSCFT